MTNFEILMLIVGIVAGIALTTAFLLPLLKKKGVNTEEIIEKVQQGLNAAGVITDGVQAAFPAMPGISLIDKIIGYAKSGTAYAEQLAKSAQQPADQRKAEAIQFVKDCLTAANIEITPDVEKIIDGAVESAVFALPKSNLPAQIPAQPIAQPNVQA